MTDQTEPQAHVVSTEEKTESERELEAGLRTKGIAILEENPRYLHGAMEVYRIRAKRMEDVDEENVFVGNGDSREAALKAIAVMASAR